MQQAGSRSGKADMTASNAESWARLRLVQGESSTQKWELTATQGNATLSVGSSPDCTWIVQEEGVRSVHFSLHWDGRTLRVADVYSAGDVRVDGALLGSQWRPLLGRVRIEFGKAAMVAETNAGGAMDEDAEIAEPPAAEPSPEAQPANPPRNAKGTLIGVVANSVLPSYLQVPAADETKPPSEPPAGGASSGSSRPKINAGSLKATLVGGVGIGGPAAAAAKNKNKHNATLMGFNAAEVLRGVVTGAPSVPVGGAGAPSSSLLDPDQRTVQGFPAIGKPSSSVPPSSGSSIAGRRLTQKGVVSRPPGVLDGAVAHVPVRAISESPVGSPSERIVSAWQEVADADGYVREPLESAEQPLPRPPRTPRISGPWGDIGDRLSDIPTQMRDHGSFATSRRRRRGFPWRYVGVLVLTAVAYFAWLYLLDHW
jgi:hypothetical protein